MDDTRGYRVVIFCEHCGEISTNKDKLILYNPMTAPPPYHEADFFTERFVCSACGKESWPGIKAAKPMDKSTKATKLATIKRTVTVEVMEDGPLQTLDDESA